MHYNPKLLASRGILVCTLEIAFLFGAAVLRADVAVESDFDNGNGTLLQWDANQKKLRVNVHPIRNCSNIWWHFRITGLTPGETITIDCDHDPIAGEAHPVYSTDGENWHRFTSSSTPYHENFNAESVYVARNIPYPYGRSLQLAARMKDKQKVDVLTLCQSEGGRDVVLLRFTDPNVPDSGKKLVWIQARQHAFESHGSWVAEGCAEWLTSSDPAAVSLLSNAIVYVVPIVDADSVFEGGAGKDQEPVDFNRCWSDDQSITRWKAVDTAITRLHIEGARANPLVLLVDMHDPYYAEPHHWHIVPFANRTLVQEFGTLFVNSLTQVNGPNSWENWFIWHDDYPVDRPTSTCYAQLYWMGTQPRGMSICMEIAHWKDNSGNYIISDGLLAYGQAMGLTASNWVASITD